MPVRKPELGAFDQGTNQTLLPTIEMSHTQVTANLRQSRTLATLRDTLLPKLLSGELAITLRDAK